MIHYVHGNLFDSEAKVLVNAVNTVGTMGKGIALEFKNRYPAMFETYRKLCQENLMTIGNLWLYKGSEKWVLCFPTKEHWKDKSELEYIELGLQKFASTYQNLNIDSIAFPKLGCGLGGLNWNDVKPLMEQYLSDLTIDVYIYV